MPIGIVVAFLLVVAEAAFIVQATTEKGCTTCHIPAQAHTEIAKGPHSSLACLDCHRTKSRLSLLELNVRAARDLIVQVSPFAEPDPSRAFVANDVCASCHRKQVSAPLNVKGDVMMSHKQVLGVGIPCQQCHSRETHGPAVLSQALDHASCSGCHDGKTAAIACGVCHSNEPARDPAKLPGREALIHTPGKNLHGMGDLTSCTICHARTFCKSCHGVELPHDMNTFPHLHGQEAIDAGGACVLCHAQNFCDSCHQMEMPHPQGYLKLHDASAKKLGETTCKRCHVAEDCEYCHEDHIHPGLPAEMLDKLRSRSGSSGGTNGGASTSTTTSGGTG